MTITDSQNLVSSLLIIKQMADYHVINNTNEVTFGMFKPAFVYRVVAVVLYRDEGTS